MRHHITIYRDYEPLTLIVRATITRNYDAPGSFLGEGDWIFDFDSITDDQGTPIELTAEEEDEVMERILR